jgi:HEXXH motif-containing protein
MRRHALRYDEFADFAAGYGTASGIAALRAGQVSRRLLMLRQIVHEVPEVRAAFDLLAAVQERSPEVYAETVALPAFGTWAALSMRIRDGVLPEQLGTFAGAAAIRAGLDFSLDVPVVRGAVYLPGDGRADASESHVAITRYRIGGVRLPENLTVESPGWTPVRRLTAVADGLRLEVYLDDVDPWRDNHDLSAARRLDAADVEIWRESISAAWRILVRHHRRYAESISAGLRTIVPLTEPTSGNAVNATSMWAFGSVSMTPPATVLTLASSLLHEFQHAKLGAILDLFELYHDDRARRFYAPWRDDPRPLGGLLHGAYAFLGVTDFWRTQRRVLTGREQRFATLEFVRWRGQVGRALATLADCDAFTDRGRRFLDGMRATHARWVHEDVPAEYTAVADEMATDHRLRWRLRNVHVLADDGRRLASAWLADEPASSPVRGEIVAHDVRALARNARFDLALLRVTDPDGFAGTCAEPAADSPLEPADRAYALGDYGAAIAGYRQRISTDPGDRSSWAGLALVGGRSGTPAAHLWQHRPELPYAVYRKLRDAGAPAPDPVRLAEWLAAGLSVDDVNDSGYVGGGSTTQ